MNSKHDTKRPYLVPVVVLVTLAAVIVVGVCLLFAERTEKPEEFDKEELSRLCTEADKLMWEVTELCREAMQLDIDNPEQSRKRNDLLQKAHAKGEKALELLKRIERYYKGHGKEPPRPPMPHLPDSIDPLPPLRPPLEPPYPWKPEHDG